MSLRAVCFDLDGLLFNTEELYELVGSQLLARRGHELTPALLDKMMGRPGAVALQVMIDTHQLDATVAELQRETDELFPAILAERLRPMPGAVELLDLLEQRRLPTAIATSSRRAYAERVLGQFDWVDRFDFLLTSEDVVRGKPAPDVYQLAATSFGVEPDCMMVLEDSQTGCQAAVAAGAFAVAVPGSHNRERDYNGARFVAESLSDPQITAALER
ncbi:MAG: HAD-IA family hydrolase [Pirellulaceae bacterium]|nr:HAD-IA family hydrolase [Pirellulaceae bacterium]